MSNLGLYQTMTNLAKKFGGPQYLGIAVAVGGYTVFRIGEAGIKKVVKTIRKHSKEIKTLCQKTYVVHSIGKSNEGLFFNKGDKYRVLAQDKESVLIEKIGDRNNPYFISSELLCSISNFNNWKSS